MSQNNRTECQDFYQHLLPYIDGELEINKVSAIEKHLIECEKCQALHEWLTELPTWEEAATATIEIPARARTHIESAVMNALQTEKKKQLLKDIPEKIINDVEKFINEIVLTFRPSSPALAFRGEKPSELPVIEHPGGDLYLDTGLTNVTLELTSIFEEFTLRGKTDEKGEVVFKNLNKGDYLASVQGYQLTEIKIKRQTA